MSPRRVDPENQTYLQRFQGLAFTLDSTLAAMGTLLRDDARLNAAVGLSMPFTYDPVKATDYIRYRLDQVVRDTSERLKSSE